MKTVVLGASTNPNRYSYIAANMLHEAGIDFELVGRREGELFDKPIYKINDEPTFEDVHTVTLYIGSSNLGEWFDYILTLDPVRIIFNPGTENDILATLAKNNGIIVDYACTLTMLTVGTY